MYLYEKIICNEGKVIEDNIYLFINWFRFNLIHAGYSHFFEVETHLSLAKKIDFQLKTNLDYSPPFIFEYLKNDLFDQSDILFHKYDLCIDLRDAIRDIHRGKFTNGSGIKEIVKGECFQGEIEDLVTELEANYLNDILDNLDGLLKDEKLITNRLDELKYFTKLIISHFLLKGYSHLDLEESFLIAGNVKPKIGVENKNGQIEIQSVDEIIDYFQELENKTEAPFTFYIPVSGVEFQTDEVLHYNNVDFISSTNVEIVDLINKTREDYDNWLVDISSDSLICKTEISALSLSSAKEQALQVFESELEYFNISLNAGGRLNGEFFIGTGDGEEFINFFRSKVREVGQFGVEAFRNNPFEFYRENLSPAKERIKRFEPYFIDAISEPSFEREISSLWHYLEILFYEKKKSNELKDLVSFTLLLNENVYNLREQINSDTFQLLEEDNYWNLGINDFTTQVRLKGESQIEASLFLSEIKNPFIKFLIEEYDSFDLKVNLVKSQAYYFRIIDEAYCIRNSFLHSGEVNQLSVTKLKYVLPFLISRIRDLIHSEIENDNSFEKIAEHLYTVGKSMI